MAEQMVPFYQIAEKEILTEAVSDAPVYPNIGDVVTVEIAEADKVPQYRSFVIGAGPEVSFAGLDLDKCVRHMRRGEKSKVKARGDAQLSFVTLWLLGHERAEDFLSNGRLVRFTVQEGPGWATPTRSSEVIFKFSWCTVPRMKRSELIVHPDADKLPTEVVLAPFTATAAVSVLDRDMLAIRRSLMRAYGPPVVWSSRQEGGAAPPAPASAAATLQGNKKPVLQITRGSQRLAEAPADEEGMTCADARAAVEESLDASCPVKPIQRSMRETTARLETNDCICSAKDFLPGSLGLRVLLDMHVGQLCMVRVDPELVAGVPGLREEGVPPDAVVEYDIELLKIMPFEDVSLVKNRGLMKKVVLESKSTDKVVEGAEVKLKVEARDDLTGNLVMEEREVTFSAASGEYCPAIDEVVTTMKDGEVCEVRCVDTSLCVDKKLGLQPQDGAVLTLRMELTEAERKDLFIMEEKYRVEHCVKRKEVGTSFFQKGDWRRALRRYLFITEMLLYVDHGWEDAQAREDALVLRRAAYLNAAMCHLKLEEWKEAADVCEAVLKEEPENVKALFRRGQAFHKLGHLREAEQSFRKCLDLDKENKEAARMIVKVRQSMKAEAVQEKAMFSKMAKSIGTDPSASNGGSSPSTSRKEVAKSRGKAAAGESGRPPDDEEDSPGIDCAYAFCAALGLSAALLLVAKRSNHWTWSLLCQSFGGARA